MTHERPHENCYWVIPGSLLAGEYPGDINNEAARKKLRDLLEHGIDFFLDLTEKRDGLKPYAELLETEARSFGVDATYRHAPIRDLGVPSSRRYMAEILDAIDDAVADDHGVYVHCWGGVGRTGVVVGCYLIRRGRTGEAALDELASHWSTVKKSNRHPKTPETPEQRRWILEWHESSNGKK